MEITQKKTYVFVSHSHVLCARSGQYATGGDSGESPIVDYWPELCVNASFHVMFTECNISVDGGHKDIAFCCEYVVMTYVC